MKRFTRWMWVVSALGLGLTLVTLALAGLSPTPTSCRARRVHVRTTVVRCDRFRFGEGVTSSDSRSDHRVFTETDGRTEAQTRVNVRNSLGEPWARLGEPGARDVRTQVYTPRSDAVALFGEPAIAPIAK